MPAPKDPERYEEWKEKLRRAAKRQWEDMVLRETMRKKAKKRWQNPDLGKLHQEKARKQWKDPKFRSETIKAQRESALNRWKDPVYREVVRQGAHLARLRDWKDPKYRKKIVESARGQWRDPKYRELHSGENHPMFGTHPTPWNLGLTKETDFRMLKISRALKGKPLSKDHIKRSLTRRIPSSLEEKFISIIERHNLPYKYTGDGSFILDNCNPDFINTNNEKIAIEVYSRYYKKRNGRNILRWKHVRRQKFSKFGWRIIFFDEIQLEEKNVLAVLENESKALAKGDAE